MGWVKDLVGTWGSERAVVCHFFFSCSFSICRIYLTWSMKHAGPPGSHGLYMHYSKLIKGCACRRAVSAGGKTCLGSQTILTWPFVFQFSACKMGKISELFIFGKCFLKNRNSAHVIICIWGKKSSLKCLNFKFKVNLEKPRSLISKTRARWLTQMDIFVLLVHNSALKREKTEFLTFFFLRYNCCSLLNCGKQ